MTDWLCVLWDSLFLERQQNLYLCVGVICHVSKMLNLRLGNVGHTCYFLF